MKRAVVEIYSPEMFFDCDRNLMNTVESLGNDHLGEVTGATVVSRTTDRPIDVVSKDTEIFMKPRFYFGRYVFEGMKKRLGSKVTALAEDLEEDIAKKYPFEGIFEAKVDEICITQAVSRTRGVHNLVLLKSSNGMSSQGTTSVTEEVRASIDRLMGRRATNIIQDFREEKDLSFAVPILRLPGASGAIDVRHHSLIANIGELLPLTVAVAFGAESHVVETRS